MVVAPVVAIMASNSARMAREASEEMKDEEVVERKEKPYVPHHLRYGIHISRVLIMSLLLVVNSTILLVNSRADEIIWLNIAINGVAVAACALSIILSSSTISKLRKVRKAYFEERKNA
jgi:uncharacterized membrane protein YcjF (UPF0283 family)